MKLRNRTSHGFLKWQVPWVYDLRDHFEFYTKFCVDTAQLYSVLLRTYSSGLLEGRD